ncbi:hypothetical protein L596_000126 [Steinernema carpocapsae]|uniref:VWFD domain-containing protein n=1 Tax=Steinernema carpocapsae TaxID=34508 RepID=A0A4U8UGX8_STECR|nr:hypothetical protein L596_000126 [Steinernema carpocapsae]
MHCDLVWKERRLLCHQRPACLYLPSRLHPCRQRSQEQGLPQRQRIQRLWRSSLPYPRWNHLRLHGNVPLHLLEAVQADRRRRLLRDQSQKQEVQRQVCVRSPSSVRCRLKCMARSSTSTTMNMVVNGIKAFFPYYWPSKTDRQLSVELRGRRAVVTNIDGVQLTFGNEYINLKVPQLDEFLGRDGLCGFSGNLNNNCTDDLIGSDGVGLIQKNCAFPRDRVGNARVAKVLDTWQTSDFYGWDPVGTDCVSGEIIAPQLPDCDTRVSARECLPIQQAGAGQGPFAACKDLGPEKIKNICTRAVPSMVATFLDPSVSPSPTSSLNARLHSET